MNTATIDINDPDFEILEDDQDETLPPPFNHLPASRQNEAVVGGRYLIETPIGHGGMGAIYRGRDLRLGRTVAIKMLTAAAFADPTYRGLFEREIRIASEFTHPSVVRVLDHSTPNEAVPFLVMELLSGELLKDRITRGGFTEAVAVQCALQLAEALNAIHLRGVYHGDVKPANILIEQYGLSRVAKLVDFGAAGELGRPFPVRVMAGTPRYMSPEQCTGAALDPRTDVYSLACVLYEMLEGRPPFVSRTQDLLMKQHLNTSVREPKNCSLLTKNVLMRALRKDRDERIATSEELVFELRRCAARLAVRGTPIARQSYFPS